MYLPIHHPADIGEHLNEICAQVMALNARLDAITMNVDMLLWDAACRVENAVDDLETIVDEVIDAVDDMPESEPESEPEPEPEPEPEAEPPSVEVIEIEDEPESKSDDEDNEEPASSSLPMSR